MALQKLVFNYTIYNEWANKKISDCLLSLDETILSQETQSSKKTKLLTF
jgi:hypothetical protein